MKYHSAVTIIGPTGVGKTKVAFELARKVGVGEVVNLDKIYTYRGFPISSGLSDTLKEKGVKKHLYEFLNPDEEIIPAEKYAEMVFETCDKILSYSELPIIEGGSMTYTPALLELNQIKNFCQPIVGLRFPKDFDMRGKFIRRVEMALEEGLLDEVKTNLSKYRNTLIMTDCHAVVPLIKYLDGNIDLEQAKKEIVDRCIVYADQQLGLFEKYPEIIWLEYDFSRLSLIVDKILTLLPKD